MYTFKKNFKQQLIINQLSLSEELSDTKNSTNI